MSVFFDVLIQVQLNCHHNSTTQLRAKLFKLYENVQRKLLNYGIHFNEKFS